MRLSIREEVKIFPSRKVEICNARRSRAIGRIVRIPVSRFDAVLIFTNVRKLSTIRLLTVPAGPIAKTFPRRPGPTSVWQGIRPERGFSDVHSV